MNYVEGKKRTNYKITMRLSINIVYRYYQFKSEFFYFKTETIQNNDFDILRVH